MSLGRRERARETERAWALTLLGGLGVLLAVWALLHALLRGVLRIDERVTAVWTLGKQLAQNTQAAHLLNTTRDRAAALADEVERSQG